MMIARLLTALVVLLSAGSLAAQGAPGVVYGIVTDDTGAVIAGADVTLTGGTAAARATTTDDAGRFRFAEVAPGQYVLTVGVAGFSPAQYEVEAPAGPSAPMNVTLRFRLTARIDVTSDVGLSTAGNLASMVLRGDDIQALPSDGRLFWQRLAEMAGAPGRPDDVAVYVDGFLRSVRLPPKEIIQMIRIDSNPFAAEFQQPGSARIEIITRPGAEQLMGQATVNFTDSILNARNPFAATQSPEQYRRYSGWLSGTVIPGRWGFLAYAGRWEQDETSVVHATVVDSGAGAPRLVNTTVATPSRTTNVSLKGNSLAGTRGTAMLLYERTFVSNRNRGVRGVSLPETAFDQSNLMHVAQFAVVSTGERTFNEFQTEVNHTRNRAAAQGSAPLVMVLDSFVGGGNQDFRSDVAENSRVSVADAITVAAGSHTVKAGGRVERVRLESTNQANFGGTFVFGTDFERLPDGRLALDPAGQPVRISPLEAYRRTLAGLAGYGPLQFSINRGNPGVGLTDWRVSLFAQDDWRLSEALTFSYGARHVRQSQIDTGAQVEPRVAVAWLPDSARKSTIRGGAGWFHSIVDPDPLLDSVRLDGRHAQQVVLRSPGFFPAVPAGIGTATITDPSAVRASDLQAPSLAVASISYERSLPAGMLAAAGVTWQRGFHLLRARNVNPAGAPVLQLESTGRSARRELNLRWRQNIGASANTYVNYVLGSSRNDTDGPRSLPADGANLAAEFGPASDDVRHQVSWGLSLQLPRGWMMSPYVTGTSAPPLNITTGRDDNGDTIFTDRAPGTGRNSGRQGGRADVSLSIIKVLRYGFTASVDASNLFNHSHLVSYNGVLTSPNFGQPTWALPARRIELGVSKQF